MKKIEKLREEIDGLDSEIVELWRKDILFVRKSGS